MHWHSGDAVFSRDGRYRYTLTRVLYPRDQVILDRTVLFICLNPSTATADTDDPTVHRCLGFAKGWGASVLEVCNIFAYRATDPKALRSTKDPIGPENDEWIWDRVTGADIIVAAWGEHGRYLDRGKAVRTLLTDENAETQCLGTNASGEPKHPLYLPASAQLVPL